ncbi:MAG: YqaJ viral recombinase family protein [Eubacteriales bacterium]|nr:YqaJ viral recombinase family protein [Eubacteriales bacterium]
MAVKMITLKSREDWLKHRTRIGGSEAAAIVGYNPYLTNVELWQIKTGQVIPEDISDKPYVQYGTQAEPLLRELFKLDFPEYKVEYVENNMWLNDKIPFGHASLDGWLTDKDGRKGIWECKTTNIVQSMQKEKWNNRIPDNYYIQILWYMAITEFEFCILKAQMRSDFGGMPYLQTRHYMIERADVQEDIDYLITAGARFWKNVQEVRLPDLVLPNI